MYESITPTTGEFFAWMMVAISAVFLLVLMIGLIASSSSGGSNEPASPATTEATG